MAPSVSPPEGAVFESGELFTAKGTQSLGEVPILVWQDLDAAVAHFGTEGLLDVLDGTSLRVSYQGIARRLKIAGKTDEEIANAQVAFKPGKRAGGSSTPKSRARKAAESAADRVGGDVVARVLERIASGEITEDQLAGAA